MDITLQARGTFSFKEVVRSHGWARLPPFSRSETFDELDYITRLSTGKLLALALRGTEGGVAVSVAEGCTPEELAEIETQVRWMLCLDIDLGMFYELAQKEPKLAHVVATGKGRLLRSATLFEDTVKSILTTNTAWGGTIRMVRQLVAAYGTPLGPAEEGKAFPAPQDLAHLSTEEFSEQVRLGYRAPYVLELARAIASGELDLEALKDPGLPTQEVYRRLLSIKGVGAYAAANLCMLLGHYDFLPIDSWALKLVSHEWHNGETVSKKDVEAAFEGWGKWKGLAYWFWDWKLLQE